MKVTWRPGYSPKGVSAQTAYDVIVGLNKQGKKTAKDLVDASRPDDAPLHSLFEWNDQIAAERYREDQARVIIRHINYEPENESEASTPIVRAFFQIDNHSSDYEPTVVIMSDEEKYKRLLEMAKHELEAFKAKYKVLKELGSVFDSIDKFLSA